MIEIINEKFGDLSIMTEKIIAGLVIFGLGVIQAFFWKSKSDQDKRIDKNEISISNAHDRITSEAASNSDRYARRDDVKAMEQRIVNTVNVGIGELKDDIRSLMKLKGD